MREGDVFPAYALRIAAPVPAFMMGERHLPGPLQKRGWRVLSQTGAAVRVSWPALPCCRSQRSLLLQHSIGAPARAHIVPPSFPKTAFPEAFPPWAPNGPTPSCAACPSCTALRRVRPPRAGRARAQPRGGVSAGGWRCGAPEGALLRCQAEMLKFSPPSRMPFEIPIRL